MPDPRLDKLAEVIVHHCARVKPGDLVTIGAEPHSMPGVEAVFRSVLLAGGYPSFHVKSESLRELLLRFGNDDQIQHVSPFELHVALTCDVAIVLNQTLNTKSKSQADPVKAAMAQKARKAGLSVGMQRMATGQVRYVLTEIPGQAAAQQAEMSLSEYEEFVYRAGFLHLPDPLAGCRLQQEQQQLAINYLTGKNCIRFQTPASNGETGETDVTVDISGGTWINCSGGDNFPDGEIYIGPRDVNGIVNFTYPAIYRGREVDGIRLEFKGGRVINASATRNQDYLFALLDTDAGASVAGELGIGTNYALKQYINNVFFDEKIGGTFHIALGAGYPHSGNSNESGIHWDIVTDLRRGGTISVDGEVIQRNGKFLQPGWPGN